MKVEYFGRMSRFDECIRKKKLVREKTDEALIKKELDQADYDLERAKNSYKDADYKWSTVQAYYVIFHSARALLFSNGYREKSHRCLYYALEHLFADSLDSSSLGDFRLAMSLREDADYGYIYSESSAKESIENAESFLKTARLVLKVD